MYCRLIFLGETFNGFISVHNDSQDIAKEVAVKVAFHHTPFPYLTQLSCGSPLPVAPFPLSLPPFLRLSPSGCLGVLSGGVVDAISPPPAPLRASSPPVGPLCLRREDHFSRGQRARRTQVGLNQNCILPHVYMAVSLLYSLICTATYTVQSGEELLLRKFFKFSVSSTNEQLNV